MAYQAGMMHVHHPLCNLKKKFSLDILFKINLDEHKQIQKRPKSTHVSLMLGE